MTLVSEIITSAYRESNILPLGQALNTNQQNEGLARLNALLASVLGYEVGGDRLQPYQLGNNNVTTPGFYEDSFVLPFDWLPPYVRIVCNLTGPETINLNPQPQNGERFGVQDLSGNFSTYNLTINGNGRLIAGNPQLVLSTDSFDAEYMFDAESGNWKQVTNVAYGDQMPYPPKFDDMWIIMLAMRINPRYGRSLDQQSALMFERARNQFRAQYRRRETVPADLPVLSRSKQSFINGDDRYGYDGSNSTRRFNSGWPY